jgi:hypothetical protein
VGGRVWFWRRRVACKVQSSKIDISLTDEMIGEGKTAPVEYERLTPS